MTTATDRIIRFSHNRQSRLRSHVEISGESRNGWKDNDHLELFPTFRRRYNSVNKSFPDQIFDWSLPDASRGDEELVFDVDEVVGFSNQLNISVLRWVSIKIIRYRRASVGEKRTWIECSVKTPLLQSADDRTTCTLILPLTSNPPQTGWPPSSGTTEWNMN